MRGDAAAGLGLNAPSVEGDVPAAHQLYRQLSDELGDGAHSRYNAILRRLASFAGAAERARRSCRPPSLRAAVESLGDA